ncbi:hypothetical protein yaldo0001_10840 [Yersinia aldovae ATCC 35236]|nr:hypothetical protein yaldo0001_10840 [Yersinia aldovae ATCC 35236]
MVTSCGLSTSNRFLFSGYLSIFCQFKQEIVTYSHYTDK